MTLAVFHSDVLINQMDLCEKRTDLFRKSKKKLVKGSYKKRLARRPIYKKSHEKKTQKHFFRHY